MVTEAKTCQNPPQVREWLDQYHRFMRMAQDCRDEANKLTGGLLAEADKHAAEALRVKEHLRGLVESLGDYKDSEGNEARIEERVSVSYDVKAAKESLPANILSLVIVEAVDANAVKGLLKGKLITEDQLKPARIEKVTKAFIVR